jgi:hypothetical protein
MSDFANERLDLEDFTVDVRVVPLEELNVYDDLSSWPEWRHGELAGLDEEDRVLEMRSFRGLNWAKRAVQWTPRTVPPIVVVTLRDGTTAVGDGRGRVSYAIGMAWAAIPVVFLRPKRGGRVAAEAAGARRRRKKYDECFVVVHLSSIDSYASYAGRDAAESLSAEIVMAARAASCVIAIDQGWDGRLGRQLLRDLNEVAAPIIFKHDEDTDGWEGFEQDFPALLHDLGVRRVVLGGLWREGCVNGVKDILEARGFQVSIDEEASGSESVFEPEEEDEGIE